MSKIFSAINQGDAVTSGRPRKREQAVLLALCRLQLLLKAHSTAPKLWLVMDAGCSGLRKVTPEMKAKNRADRTGAVPATPPKESKPQSPAPGTATMGAVPLFELQQGRK